MLCPEVWNFASPKIITSLKKNLNLESTTRTIKNVNFYKSVIVTCSDDLQTPKSVEEALLEDTDYYRISNCSLNEFVEDIFIEKFIRNGNLYCLSADRNCLVHNCVSITPKGILTIHIPRFVYQTLGLEGAKCANHYYEVTIDLKNLKHLERLKYGLKKIDDIELMDYYMLWEPDSEDICPSSIAKYFSDKNINVSLCSLVVKRLTPTVTEIPSIKDVSPDEMVEWLGMLAHNLDMTETESYISTFYPPDSKYALESSRMSVLIVKGILTPTVIAKACKNLEKYVMSREINNYWASLSLQSCEDSILKWRSSSPMMFQSHNLSCNIFIEHSGNTVYTVGQIKYT